MQWLMRWLHKLWQHPIIVLVLGTMVGWALENYFTVLAKAEAGTLRLLTLALAVVSVVILSWVGRALWRRSTLRQRTLIGFPPAAHRGLIFLFSKPETLKQAVIHHQPRLEYLCLIVSDSSVVPARAAVAKLQEEGYLDQVKVREEQITDHLYPTETSRAVERAVRQGADLALAKHDLICDVTGGTKAMTVGALTACLLEDLPIEMVAAHYSKELDAPQPENVIQLRLD